MKKQNKYKIGDVVYLKSDIKNKIPMTITEVLEYYITDDNCICEWLNAQKTLQRSSFPEEALKQ